MYDGEFFYQNKYLLQVFLSHTTDGHLKRLKINNKLQEKLITEKPLEKISMKKKTKNRKRSKGGKHENIKDLVRFMAV